MAKYYHDMAQFILLLLLFSTQLKAQTLCDTIFRSQIYGCNNRPQSNAMGGSFPMLYDAFNSNPASVPIYKTPFGIEYTHTGEKNNFALIKGQNNWGAGFSSKSSDTTFFGPYENYKAALKKKFGDDTNSLYLPRALDPFYNLSSAANLSKVNVVALPLGISFRYNPEKQIWSPQVGFGIKSKYFTMGASYYAERPKKSQDDVFIQTEQNNVLSFSAGLKLSWFLFDYSSYAQRTKIKYETVDSQYSYPSSFKSTYVVRTDILSTSFVYGGLNISYAVRKQDDSRAKDSEEAALIDSLGEDYKTTHELFGVTYRFGQTFSLGYYYNYQLDSADTIVAQLFFNVK